MPQPVILSLGDLKRSRPDLHTPMWRPMWSKLEASNLTLAQAIGVINSITPRPTSLAEICGVAQPERQPAAGRRGGMPDQVSDITDPMIARAMGLLPPEPPSDPSGAIHYPGLRG